MNEENQKWLYNYMQLEQILLVLESLDSDIDQESFVCLLNHDRVKQLYYHYKELSNLLFIIPKMHMV